MKWSKLFLIDLTLMLNVCRCLLLWLSLLSHASLQLVKSSHNISIIYCYSILPLVHSKLMSHYQLSNFVIYGLDKIGWASSYVTDFNTRNKLLTQKLLKQGYRYHKLRKTFSKFYRRYFDLISKFQVGLKSLLREGLSEPDFYGGLVYKLKKIVGSNNFSAQFIKIISHYKKIGYNINVLQQTACLVVNPITVGNFAFLFNCTPVGRTSDSMMVPT